MSDSDTGAVLHYSHILTSVVLVMEWSRSFELRYRGNPGFPPPPAQRLIEEWELVESFSYLELVGVVEVGVEAARM